MTFTINSYSDLLPTAQEKAAEKLDALLMPIAVSEAREAQEWRWAVDSIYRSTQEERP
jgi:hypothetical protein